MINYFNVDIGDLSVTEKEKAQPEYLMAYTDHLIAELISENSYRRKLMGKMRDMYEGIRDKEEYAYLTNNYGIGNPADIKFTPVIRNRVEALIGLLSTTAFDYKVTAVDSETIKVADIMKSAEILAQIYRQIEKKAKLGQVLYPKAGDSIERMADKASQLVQSSWRSVFEVTAGNLLKYYQQDPDINMMQKRSILFEDIAVVGECAFRVLPEEYGKIPVPDVLLPENLYYDLPRDKKFIRESRRAVYLRYMTKEDALKRYGHLMTEEQLEEVFNMTSVSKHHIIATANEIDRFLTKSKDSKYTGNINYIPVYEAEWIANNPYDVDDKELKGNLNVDGPDKTRKKRYRQDRYQSVRIGADIYINMGRSEFVKRSQKDPDVANLSFDGVRFSDRNGDPYSLVWKCKDIQDMMDINIYHRDNLIANSGVNGSRLNVAALPKFLGSTMMERLMKVIALRKQGVDPVDPSQEGANLFQHYGDFNNALPGQTLQAINQVIEQLDTQASKITGITPQMMGIIEQREAVSNVKMGVNQASLVIRNFYDHHDVVMKHILLASLQMTQVSMADTEFLTTLIGDVGTKVFKMVPKNFAFSDFNLFITSISDEYTKLQNIKTAAQQMSASGIISPQLAFKVLKSDSVTEVLNMVERELSAKGMSDSEAEMLKGKLEQATKESQDLSKKLEKFQQDDMEIRREANRIKMAKVDKDYQTKLRAQDIDEEFNQKTIDYKHEVVKLERDQLYLDTKGNASEIKNNI